MKKYRYSGPAMWFNKCIKEHWSGETIAVSPAKARNNLTYQFKRENHFVPSANITLPGKLEEVD